MQLNATLEASCVIPQSAETGNWQVDTIISDNAGNIALEQFHWPPDRRRKLRPDGSRGHQCRR